MKQTTTTLQLYGMLLAAAVLWGGNVVAAKMILTELPPITTAFYRFTLFTLITFGIIFYRSGRPAKFDRHLFLPLVMLGILGIFLNNLALFTGLRFTNAVNTVLIIGTNPVFTSLFAYLLDGDRLSRKAMLGIAISFAGIFLVITKGSPEIIRSLNFNTGDLIIIAMPVTWSLYTVYIKKITGAVPVLEVTGYTALVGTLCFLPLAYAESGLAGLSALSPAGWIELLFMALGSGFLAFALWNYAVPYVGANRAIIFSNAVPASGVIFSWLLLNESLQWAQIAGFVAIMAGISLSASGQTGAGYGKAGLTDNRQVCACTHK